MSAAPVNIFDGPSDIATAESLLGLLIIHGAKAYLAAAEHAQASDFLSPHDAIFAAVGALVEIDQPVRPLTVKAKIGPAVEEIGGLAYLANLCAAAPAVGNALEREVGALAQIVHETALRRRIAGELSWAKEIISDCSKPLREAVRGIVELSEEIAVRETRQKSTSEAAYDMAAQLERASRGELTPFITCGVPAIDKETGGLQAGELAIIAGRPGMGKSAGLFSLLYRAALNGSPAIGFSLEMRRQSLFQRMACDIDYDLNSHDAPLVYMRCRTPERLGRREVERYAEAMTHLPPSLHIYDDGGMTMEKIAAISRKHAAQSDRMGVIVIDYLQKVQASDRYAGSRVQEVTEIVGKAKTLAMSLGWPVVCGCQLNRAVEGRTDRFPTLADLRETGAIEQDADIVIGLYREAYYVRQEMRKVAPQDSRYATLEANYNECRNRLAISFLKFRQGSDETYEAFCDMASSVIRNKGHRRGEHD